VSKGSRTPREAQMTMRSLPRRPISTLFFEASRQIQNGRHAEWRKYVIGV
jgi:hypothetical protein